MQLKKKSNKVLGKILAFLSPKAVAKTFIGALTRRAKLHPPPPPEEFLSQKHGGISKGPIRQLNWMPSMRPIITVTSGSL